MSTFVMIACGAVLTGCLLYLLLSKSHGPNRKTSAQEDGLFDLFDDALDMADELDDAIS